MQEKSVPTHVGIIMDGNGRWAKRRGIPRIMGHKRGAKVFGEIVKHVSKTPIRFLTAYAFSTENWKRPPEEVAAIMDLLRTYLGDVENYRDENIRITVIGDVSALDADIRERITYIQNNSRDNTGLTVNIALNYGGRAEILNAAGGIAKLYAAGGIPDIDALDERLFERCLYTAGQPDVDLVIRTSGEKRISNFLLWQSAYAEYIFTEVLWPDFTPEQFDGALREYAGRARRMGNIG